MRTDAFIGRTEELSVALEAWNAASSGQRQVLLVAGEPGIGKTRLATEVARSAADHGAAVYWGRTWESGGAPALWPWIQLLRGCVELPAVPDIRARLGPAAGIVEDILAGAHSQGDAVRAQVESRFAVFDAITRFLHEVSMDQPLLLILEDLHAADASSLQLFEFVTRSRPDARLMVMGTYRIKEAEDDPSVGSALATIAKEGKLVELRGLAPTEIAELATAAYPDFGGDTASVLHGSTGGNPLFVKEILRATRPEEIRELADPTQSASVAIRRAIRRRIMVTSPEVGWTLGIASILGRTVAIPLLLKLASEGEAQIRRHIGRAASEGFVRLAASTDEFTFVHDLVRAALYEELPQEEREGLHRRAAESLEELHRHEIARHSDLIGHHYMNAGRASREKASEYLRSAGEVSMTRYAYEAAEERFRQALSLSDPDDRVTRCDLLILLASAQWRAGNAEAAATAAEAEEEARRLQDGDRLAQAILAAGTAGLGNPYSRMDDLIARMDDALENLPPSDDSLRARLLGKLVAALSGPSDSKRRHRLIDEALTVAARVKDDLVLGEVLWWATVTIFFERSDEQPVYVDQLLEVVERLRRTPSPSVQLRARELDMQARRVRSMFLLEQGDLMGFERETASILRSVEELNQPTYRFVAESIRGAKDQMSGQVAQMEERAARLPQLVPDEIAVFICYFVQAGWALYEQDRIGEMRSLFQELLEGMPRLTGLRLFLAMDAIQNSRPEDARSVLAPVTADLSSLPYDAQWFSFIAALAGILRDLDENELCAQVYDLLLPHRDRHVIVSVGQPTCYLGAVELHLGLAAHGAGMLDRAVEHLRASIVRHSSVGATAYVARSKYELAMSLRASGDRHLPEARALAEEALQHLEPLPMAYLKRLVQTFLGDPQLSNDGSITFQRDGDVWTVGGKGRQVRVKQLRGFEYLARLVAAPGVEISALELLGGGTSAWGDARTEPNLEAQGSTSVPVLDERAKNAYRKRIQDLQDDLAEAESNHDTERAALLREELQLLVDELKRAAGLAGRTRAFSEPTEKARLSVTKAIKRAIGAIRMHDRDLADDLERRVGTGTFCVYHPES